MITKVGKVFGLQLDDAAMDVSNLDDINGVEALRNIYATKAQEPKTSLRNAMLVGGFGGLTSGAVLGGATGKLAPTVIGAALLGAAGSGLGAAMKYSDDKDIETSKELKEAPNTNLLRALSAARHIQKQRENADLAASIAMYNS